MYIYVYGVYLIKSIKEFRNSSIDVEIGWHFISENWESGEICIPYVSSKGQLIDFLTKVLSSSTFQSILGKLGMGNIFDPA